MRIEYLFAIFLMLCVSCHSLQEQNFNGFWITENKIDLLYIDDEILLNNLGGLNCINKILLDSGGFYWVDYCINKQIDQNPDSYLIELQNDQLLVFFKGANEIPLKYNSIDFEKCTNNIELISVSFWDIFFGQNIDIGLNVDKKIAYVNGAKVKTKRSLDWLKTYCFHNIELSRTDMEYPIAPTGHFSINLKIRYSNGVIENYRFNSLLEAPIDVQALLMFVVSFSYPSN